MDDLWATKSGDVGLIVCAISFQDFHLCGPDTPMSQTDEQMTCNCKTALCTIVHRMVKTEWWDAGMVVSGSTCRFAYGPVDATATYYLLLQ